MAMKVLGTALRTNRRLEEALPVLELHLTLTRRFVSDDESAILFSQRDLACGLDDAGRLDEALVLRRTIYARRLATLGVSNEGTLLSGNDLGLSLTKLELWDEAKTLIRDQLLPVARRTLGADHHMTLHFAHDLARALLGDPKRTRDDPRVNRNRRGVDATRA